MKKPIFTGANVAICTPFSADGTINYSELEKLIEFQIENGTSAITICGTTGETCTLSDQEHREVIEFAARIVNKRVVLIAGTGSNDTAYAISLSKHAEEAGADGLLLVSPYYNKSSQKGLIAHFTAIADSVNIPVILYNVPSRTGVNITPDTYFELSKHPNINGTKEANGDISSVVSTIAKCGHNLNIWTGNDDQIVPMMVLGAKGVISVMSNIFPKKVAEITSLCAENKYNEASKLQIKYSELIDSLFCDVNPIPIKFAMNYMGYNMGELRLPLIETCEQNQNRIKNAINQLK